MERQVESLNTDLLVYRALYVTQITYFTVQLRLLRFEIHAGSTTTVDANTLCWKEDGQVGNSKQFKCQPKPITGRYLTIKKEGVYYDQYPLTLCEVVVIGGKYIRMGNNVCLM